MIGLLRASEYYTRLASGPLLKGLCQIGQWFWTPSLFLLNNRSAFVVRSTYSETCRDYKYRIEKTDLLTEFEGPQQPNYTLGIHSDQRPLVVGAKRRPVILISRSARQWRDSTRTSDDCYLVAPVYSFAGDETKTSYSTQFIERVKGYVYRQLFYLPAGANGRIREGFVRLDRIHAVPKELMEHMPLMLSDDAKELLQHWIRFYLGENLDEVNDVLFQYRQQALESLGVKN